MIPTISNRVSTGCAQEYPQVFGTQKLKGALELLADRVAEQAKALRATEVRIEELEGQIKKLRGQFFAERKHARAEEQEPGTKTLSREQLKASLVRTGRFMPGQPPNHGE